MFNQESNLTRYHCDGCQQDIAVATTIEGYDELHATVRLACERCEREMRNVGITADIQALPPLPEPERPNQLSVLQCRVPESKPVPDLMKALEESLKSVGKGE